MSFLAAVASLPKTALNLINTHTKTNVQANATTSKPGVKAAATPTSTAAQATTDIGSTFLSLLTKELQNQDPTAPMDSTAMVGQMISLNQLDQLIAINQNLTPTTTTTTKHSVSGPSADSASTLAANQALLASTNPSLLSSGNPLSTDSTLNAAAQSASNAAALNLSNFNSMFGGK
jgi:flagellar basal-body rod modification protein FlgD